MISATRRLSHPAFHASFSFPTDNYARWCLLNFLFASFMCVLREPSVFWSLSKIFSSLYSLAIALNVIQWFLMYGSVQLLLKNISFNMLDSRFNVGYLLSNQPYATFFLYLLLEFLVFISSMAFYYYAYVRFQSSDKGSCYDRCSSYCPSLIAIIILLLYTACKMPLVHDIFLLYIQTRIRLLVLTFVFEIVHVLIIMTLWIFLTTKTYWTIKEKDNLIIKAASKTSLKSSPIQSVGITPPQPPKTTLSMPDLNRNSSSKEKLNEKPYEKIRIFQSEICYQNRPKNWSLPLHQQPSMMAAFDTDDDIALRPASSSIHAHKSHDEPPYRNSNNRDSPNIYQYPKSSFERETGAVFYRTNTPPVPPVKRFTKEQVEAARRRAEQMFLQQQRTADYIPHRHSAALLISQV